MLVFFSTHTHTQEGENLFIYLVFFFFFCIIVCVCVYQRRVCAEYISGRDNLDDAAASVTPPTVFSPFILYLFEAPRYFFFLSFFFFSICSALYNLCVSLSVCECQLSRKEEKNRGNIKKKKKKEKKKGELDGRHSQYPICFFSRFLLIAHILDFPSSSSRSLLMGIMLSPSSLSLSLSSLSERRYLFLFRKARARGGGGDNGVALDRLR